MKKSGIAALGMAGLAGLGLVSCSALNTFDTLVPKDSGVALAAHNAAFGPGKRQRLDVYRPKVGSNLPIIVFIYGGSWSSGDKDGYSFVGRALAARGFVVAIPDYRLVPAVRYPAFLEDNASAVRWVIAHAGELGGDPKRIVMAGHSAGAYNAAMLAYDQRWLGPDQKRVRAFLGLAGPYDFAPFDVASSQAAFKGSNPPTTQPVNFIGKGDPPAFLATGEEDRTVRPRNSDALAAKLRAAGIAVDRERYPNIGHIGILTAIARPFRGRAPVLEDMARFAHEATGARKD